MATDEDWLDDQIRRAEAAIALVEVDLGSYDGPMPEISLSLEDGNCLGCWVNGDTTGSFLDLDGEERAKASIADCVQSELHDGPTPHFWPTCRAHDRGLHPELRGGVAVWWCRGGEHDLGKIGELNLDS